MYIKEFSFISSSQAYLLYELNLHLFDHVVTYITMFIWWQRRKNRCRL